MRQDRQNRMVDTCRLKLLGLLWPFLLGAGLSVALLVSDGGVHAVADFLQLVGSPYVVESNGSVSGEGGSTKSSEYLLIFSKETDSKNLFAYLKSRSRLNYSGDSVYPNTIRVNVDIPVGDSLKQLKAQPFTRFVFKNLPLFFCH